MQKRILSILITGSTAFLIGGLLFLAPVTAQNETVMRCADMPQPPLPFVFSVTKAHVKAVGESVDLVWSINAGRGSCRALDGFTLENGGAEGKKTIQILNQTNYFPRVRR